MSTTADRRVHQAITLFQQGQTEQAAAMLEQTLTHNPKHFEALHALGIMRGIAGQTETAIDLLGRAAAVQPEHALAHFNLAKALSEAERDDEALPHHEHAVKLAPNHPQAWLNYGRSLNNLLRFDEALVALDKAISLQPNYAEAWTNRGMALTGLGRHEDAMHSNDKSLHLNPSHAEAWNNQAVAFNHLLRYEDCLYCCGKALEIKPDLIQAWITKGQAEHKFKIFHEAVQSYEKALEFDDENSMVWMSKGRVHFDMSEYEKTVLSYEKALSVKRDIPTALGLLVSAKMYSCNWQSYNEHCQEIIETVLDGKLSAASTNLLSTGVNLVVLHRAATMAGKGYRFFAHDADLYMAETKATESPPRKIRVGYFSSDLNSHPVGQLAQHLFENHDKSAFEIIGFFLTDPADLDITRHIQGQFDAWHVLSEMPSEEATKFVREQKLDIAIDLNGYTKDSRTELFARRVAPIQVNYLGYAGTLGAPFMDYILADPRVIPPEDEPYYTEKVVHLPHSFFITHSLAKVPALPSDRGTARKAQGLPENGFVFSCFNNSYKIDPDSFAAWTRMLQAVPESVLWLSQHPLTVRDNLRKEAAARGIDPNRLVFARIEPEHTDHLRRISLADLFIDTKNYNAHTTACEALMMGLPVLTCTGQSFSGKVAHSLLHAVGLPDMVTHNLNDFERRGIELANNSDLLGQVRIRLLEQRHTKPLFDNELTTRKIEAAYKMMHERHLSGLAPAHLDIPE
jgi:protein O-GlcNAc transferase